MAILRPLLFRKSAASSTLEDVVPLLMDLLDARDSAARAVVLLVAEYFASYLFKVLFLTLTTCHYIDDLTIWFIAVCRVSRWDQSNHTTYITNVSYFLEATVLKASIFADDETHSSRCVCLILEISCDSKGLLVGSWLFCVQHLPCSVSLPFMLGGSVEVWTKNILCWFIEGQTHFGMPRGARITLALNELKYVVLHLNSNTTSKNAPQVERN